MRINTKELERVEKELASLRLQLAQHPLYGNITRIEHIKIFTEMHVYAVWDFMSLLKTLQQKLTCVSTPWSPVKDNEVARFINEIVLEEETDLDENGMVKSHFQMYVEAMEQAGAKTASINQLIQLISEGESLEAVFRIMNLPEPIKDFLTFTFSTIATDMTHLIGAAFAYGREMVLPDVFERVLESESNANGKDNFSKFRFYLNRHIELDGDTHGPLTEKMISHLCGFDKEKWQEVTKIAKASLQMRIGLWDCINERVLNQNKLMEAVF